MELPDLGRRLRAEARSTDQRRMVVLSGERGLCYEAVEAVLDGGEIDVSRTTYVGAPDSVDIDGERVALNRATQLLGTTRDAVVVDLHEALSPNAIGATVGAVDGGGLYILLTPSRSDWAERPDGFDERIAAPPFTVAAVGNRFQQRLVSTLHRGRGIAIVDLDEEAVIQHGTTDPAPRLVGLAAADPPITSERSFPQSAYDRCLTDDQHRALLDLEALRDSPVGIVVQADRGRGKSSAAGLAAGALAADGESVLVTAPQFRNAREVLLRAREVLDDEGVLAEARSEVERSESNRLSGDRAVEATTGGAVRYRSPSAAVDAVARSGDERSSPDVVIVDEAASLPVRRLEALLDADRIVFATTTYGYEGTGRGFTVRFRDRLGESRHELLDVRLDEPIRFAAGDPVETWAFDALLLNATPVPGVAIDTTTADSVDYRQLRPDTLVDDEQLLREAFGLLVLAHYRTEPDDLARLLDAPNLAVRALTEDGHIVAVALLAREGGLSADIRRSAYDGDRIRGNMLPDVLMSQLRDEDAGRPVGARVVRIATHPDVRNRGLGSRLLDRVKREAATGIYEWSDAPRPEAPPEQSEETDPSAGLDWMGVSYGATSELLRFWAANGYRTVHLSTTRNDRSGEYSALMLDPISEAGTALHDRTAQRFARRIGGVCAGPLDDADPDVLRAALAAVDSGCVPAPTLTAWEWSVVAGASYGPGMADVAPHAFRRLAVRWLIDRSPDAADDDLDPDQQRLLVRKALQGCPWPAVATDLGFPSAGNCMRAFGDAYEPIVDQYGSDSALAVRDRYSDMDGAETEE